MRSGMMKHCEELLLPSAAGRSANGFLSLILNLRSSTTSNVSTNFIISWPKPSRAPQRLIEAMQSAERTGSLSWNFSPSRNPST
jgi:hypothetical protein